MPPPQATPGSLPSAFATKKSQILSSLSVPDTDYSDKSPKGSVDAGIRDLIVEINAYPGLVTTSSCAGRVSVFVEGKSDEGRKGAVKGGKGGGKWLFVSHEPVSLPESVPQAVNGEPKGDGEAWMKMFGLKAPLASRSLAKSTREAQPPRLIRLSFEPLILHVLCVSLAYARPLLGAAVAAGFRESGVQSLKNLHDVEACPMVAVRSAGLGFESVVGVVREDGGELYQAVVDEEYLEMMMQIVRGRFGENEIRRDRFREELRKATGKGKGPENSNGLGRWEDTDARRERKREEGLRRQLEKREAQKSQRDEEVEEINDSLEGVLMG